MALKIRFFAGSFKTKRASHRLRGEVIAQALREQGWDAQAGASLDDVDANTVVVFLKLSEPQHIQIARDRGARTIYDVCDNKFTEKPEYAPCCQAAHAITVNSPAMAQSVLYHTGLPSVVIPDPHERPWQVAAFAPERDIRLLWYGGGSSLKFFPMVEVWQRLEREIGNYQFTMVTAKADRILSKMQDRQRSGVLPGVNFDRIRILEWDWALQGRLLTNTDIVLMPVNVQHYRTETKSANRVIDALISGRFVITSPLDSYQEFADWTWQKDYIDGIGWCRGHPYEALQRIAQGQAYTREHYSPAVIAQRWLEVIHA